MQNKDLKNGNNMGPLIQPPPKRRENESVQLNEYTLFTSVVGP